MSMASSERAARVPAKASAGTTPESAGGGLRGQLRGMSYDEGAAALAPEAAAPVQREAKGTPPAPAPATAGGAGASGEGKVPAGMYDKAGALKLLNDMYGAYTKIAASSVLVLGGAAFAAKHDELRGPGSYAKKLKQFPGGLEGFNKDGVQVINADLMAVDTVPHEILHNNASPNWKKHMNRALNEGTTEYLTIDAVTAAGRVPTHSYADEEGCVRELIFVGLSKDRLRTAYFCGDTESMLIDWVDEHCTGSFDEIQQAMDDGDYAKARTLIRKPDKAKKKTKGWWE